MIIDCWIFLKCTNSIRCRKYYKLLQVLLFLIQVSDYRLKRKCLSIYVDGFFAQELKATFTKKPFNWIAKDETNTLQDGFFAHEVSSIVPEAVTGEKDAR